jgi:prepilin-type N-terminal cleavage/methylation domain-containing protein/prepilin-type processing-associated H-X9-DG protein
MRRERGFTALEGPRLAGTRIRIANRHPERRVPCHSERSLPCHPERSRGVRHRERDAPCSRPDVSTSSRFYRDSARHDRGNVTAFTLIELLVVISVIALLMAILVPTLQRVKRQAKAVVCRANLRQWGTILALYTEDSEGHFPPSFLWFLRGSHGPDDDPNKPPVYHHIRTKGIACCPMAARPADPEWSAGSGTSLGIEFTSTGGSTFEAWEITSPPPPFRCSYGFNVWLSDFKRTCSIYSVSGKAEIPVLLDCEEWWGRHPEWMEPPPIESAPYIFMGWPLYFCINRHDGGINGLFMDWSVRKIGLKELWTLKWHREYDTAGPWTKAGGVKPEDWPKWMRRFKDY